jgi:ubiquinone/menaquinone biosynthesis C-methylase UbiE
MPLSTENKAGFWDSKILGWEKDKYESRVTGLRHLFDVNRSLKTRMDLARSAIRAVGPGTTILELGCGSALLLPEIVHSKVKRYVGVDISTVAIARARAHAEHYASRCSIEFLTGEAQAMDLPEADLCFSLGLLDWLEPEEMSNLLRSINCRYYLHSYSRYEHSLRQALHRLYVYSMYGHKYRRYTPRYYTEQSIDEIFSECCGEPPAHFRSPRLSFGALAYRLPSPNRLPQTEVLWHFDSVAKHYESRSRAGLWKHLRVRELEGVRRMIGSSPVDTAIDLGCGSGYYSRLIKETGCRRLICVDFSRAMLEALNLDGCEKIEADIEKYRGKKNVDIVVCAGALEFLEHPEEVFHNASVMLKPEGALVVLTPRECLAGHAYRAYHRLHSVGIRLFDLAVLDEWAQAAGLRLDHYEDVAPFSIVARFSKRGPLAV